MMACREFSRATTRFPETRSRLPDKRRICIRRRPEAVGPASTQTYQQTSSLRRRTRAEDTRVSSERVRRLLVEPSGDAHLASTRACSWSLGTRCCPALCTQLSRGTRQSDCDHLVLRIRVLPLQATMSSAILHRTIPTSVCSAGHDRSSQDCLTVHCDSIWKSGTRQTDADNLYTGAFCDARRTLQLVIDGRVLEKLIDGDTCIG